MDPSVTMSDMLIAYDQKDFDLVREYALALKEWIDRGGFVPSPYTQGSMRFTIAMMLLATAHIETKEDDDATHNS